MWLYWINPYTFDTVSTLQQEIDIRFHKTVSEASISYVCFIIGKELQPRGGLAVYSGFIVAGNMATFRRASHQSLV